ncbi:ABC transporter substrate-binding protein [Azoarcus olearius]|uniref:Extracellular ligand binding protein n=1 Tax=Azoarcus sp. (strain BH72) TaxID=418699 RepID=A1K1D2_AZOSB|nr:ABC transporter substrate-binding protein [Azoarcus olearius]ANQ83112.1 extracellular ligand binding protein [Azoarcus olearius]CAL92637.1 extracellular ligand binding protein [Azoarcus olearius]
MIGRRSFALALCCALVAALSFHTLPARAEPGAITVGQSIVLSGPQAANGLLYARGIKLQLDAVNAAGGVNGKPVRLVTLDDGYDPERCKENTRRLIAQDKVVALFGYTGTGPTAACAPLAEAARVPLLAPLTGAPELREDTARYLFHTRASYLDEMRKMVEYLTTVGVRDIAVVYQDDGFGRSGLRSAETVLAAYQLKPAAVGSIPPQTYDPAQAVAALGSRAPGAVILATAGQASVNFIRAYLKSGKRTQFFGLSVVSSNQLLKELGQDTDGVVISQVVPSPWSQSTQVVRDFQRDAAAAKDVEVNHTTLEGYIAARVLVEGLRRAGPDPSPEKLTQALENLHSLNLGGYEVGFGPGRRAGSRYVDLSLVRGSGRYVQ